MSTTHTQDLHRALALLHKGKLSQAKAVCKKVLHQVPEHFDARHLYGVLQLKSGHYQQATKELKCALDLPCPARQKAMAFSNLALSLHYQGQQEQALNAANQALALDPLNLDFLANRANIHESLQDWRAMYDDFQQATEQAPEDSEYILGKAAALRQLGQTDDAIQCLKPLFTHRLPSLEVSLEYLLLLCLKAKDREALSTCATLNKHYQENLLRLTADYLCESGLQQAAIPFYQKALELEPEHQSIRHMLDALEGRQRDQAPLAYVADLYDAHAAGFERRLIHKLRYRLPALLPAWLGLEANSHLDQVWDLGCGTGLVGEALHQQTAPNKLVGIDLSAGMLAEAEQKGCYDDLQKRDLWDFLTEQDEESADLICALDVFIYVGRLEQVFEQVARTLKPRGRFAFSIETSKGEPVHLCTSGRFQHSLDYVQDSARQAGLTWEKEMAVDLRIERGESQAGYLIELRRPA